MNMMAPSPAVPNLLDGGGLLNPAPTGMPAQLQLNHEAIAPQNQTSDFSSGLYIGLSYHICQFQNTMSSGIFVVYHERALYSYFIPCYRKIVANTIHMTYAWGTMGRLGVIPSKKQQISCILIGSELTNQSARKSLFTCVVYTNYLYACCDLTLSYGSLTISDMKFILDLSIAHFFRVYIASSKHEEGWENSRQLCNPET